ncbi:mitogen-activated protein kinase kinase kinase 20-like [Capsicum chacoense]
MDKWMKLFLLGAGSCGNVYYAVKFHSSSLSAEVAAVKCSDYHRTNSLELEAKILTALKGCPNVIQSFGSSVSMTNGIPTYNLFLEYACGGSLHDLIINSKKGMMKMSELEVGFYAYQLLNVFDNERGGMHKLKLADFGLSLRVDDGMAYMTGRPLSNRGTLLYAPQESLTCGYHSKAYDIWSIGYTVAEMMTGSRVWNNRGTKEYLEWQIMNKYPVIRSIVSENAKDFLHRCFIRDPLRRWTSEQLM